MSLPSLVDVHRGGTRRTFSTRVAREQVPQVAERHLAEVALQVEHVSAVLSSRTRLESERGRTWPFLFHFAWSWMRTLPNAPSSTSTSKLADVAQNGEVVAGTVGPWCVA